MTFPAYPGTFVEVSKRTLAALGEFRALVNDAAAVAPGALFSLSTPYERPGGILPTVRPPMWPASAQSASLEACLFYQDP